MGNYIKDKDYSYQISQNLMRDDYNCPCCNNVHKLSDSKLEKFEIDREFTMRPKIGYLVRYGAFRICPKCDKRRTRTVMIPIYFIKIYAILAVVTSIIACLINFDKYGTITIGFWLGAATPLWILVWLIPNLIWLKASTFRKLDFDKCLEKNAVDWNPQYNDHE